MWYVRRVFRHILLLAALACSCSRRSADTPVDAGVPSKPVVDSTKPFLRAIGPRLVSNQTKQPLALYGDRFKAPMTLSLATLPQQTNFAVTVLDEHHAFAMMPANLGVGDAPEVVIKATLLDGAQGEVELRIANDTPFPMLTGLVAAPDGSRLFTVSTTQDTLLSIDAVTHDVTVTPTKDGPSALAMAVLDGDPVVVIAHQFDASLELVGLGGTTVLPGPKNASAVVVQGDVAYVAEQARDTVVAISLRDGKELWRTPVDPNPRELAVADGALAVGSIQAGTLLWLDLKDGHVLSTVQPKPGTPIVGGTTKAFSKYVMGGTAPRGLAYSKKLKSLFVSSIGPNVGPNPEKMEVSMNGGVGVATRTDFKRHLGFGAGVTEALLLDETANRLYAVDPALGLLRVLDAAKLVKSDSEAANALVQELALPSPPEFPLVRDLPDFNTKGRAGTPLHSGPKALAMAKGGLWVLNRFTGQLALVSLADKKRASFAGQWPLVDTLTQKTRRLGEIEYFADMGRTAMSCDACHQDGHTGGLFFAKTHPLRVYRSPTVRGARETPPYFTPASTFSIGETAKFVGARNRYHNPDPTPAETEALTLFTSLVATLPNPFVGEDGAPVESLQLPDGETGHPRAGMALFEGKAGCVECHPGPHFTMDQSVETRGKYIDVGTPHILPLREDMQSPTFVGFGTPALIGSWDVWPMLTTGLAGLEVRADGSLGVAQRFSARVAVEGWPGKHGHADQLSAQEKNDLLAYVMSL